MEAEVYFLRYAFPCSSTSMQRGEINQEQFDELREAAINNRVLPREKLERVYHRAFEIIGKLANELNRDKWDLEVIKEYFLKRHNEIIEEGMYDYKRVPASLRELCKVHRAEIVKINDNVLTVRYNGKKKKVLSDLVRDVREGDMVNIHHGYAVEKL